ncbi:hypothetical protein CTAYLR_006724 [Chrysophaeum taylorii]|uniref:FAD-binding PCMH-type domain-containing protein n=1 Tax=Chrysophaeum taylorii TaxID=2483200 RepID=A0AAD7XKI8_9STRA|nr:hypothetical protein CTAYLR_006724 [Chrysophaeum taylorii]
MDGVVGVCLVGCGWYMCRVHCASLRKLRKKGVRVVAVCSRRAENRRRAVRKLGLIKEITEYASLGAALRDPRVEVCVVALPRSAACDAVVACLLAGKHVISEKPGAWSREEGERCWSALRRGVTWRVLENWAFKPGVRRVAEILDTLDGPRRYEFVVRQRPPSGWRLDECSEMERVIDVCVHVARAVRAWFGEVEVLGRHETGAVGRIDFEWSDEDRCSCDVWCGGGGERKVTYDVARRVIVLVDGQKEIVAGDPWIEGGAKEALAAALGEISRNGDEAPETSAEEALRDLAVAQAVAGAPFRRLRRFVAPAATPQHTWVARPRSARDATDVSGPTTIVSGPTTIVGASSWGRPSKPAELAVRASLLDRVLGVCDGACVVEAGVTLRRLVRALAARSLCLPSLPVFQNATIGGAIATGSHGSSAHRGTLSDDVLAIDIVRDGHRFWLARDAAGFDILAAYDSSDDGPARRVDASLFDAARASVGRMGFILKLALAVVPAYRVKRRHETARGPIDETLEKKALDADHAWVHWFPSSNKHVALFLDVDSAGGDLYDGRNWFPYPKDLANALPRDVSSFYSAQYSVPLDDLSAAARDLADAIRPHLRDDDDAVIEIKFLRAPEEPVGAAPCAPNAAARAPGDRVACFNVYVPAPPPPWVTFFERFLQARGAHPHYGKGGLFPPKGDAGAVC